MLLCRANQEPGRQLLALPGPARLRVGTKITRSMAARRAGRKTPMQNAKPDYLWPRAPVSEAKTMVGALLKNEQDVHLFERLAFMARREGR